MIAGLGFRMCKGRSTLMRSDTRSVSGNAGNSAGRDLAQNDRLPHSYDESPHD